LPFFCRIFNKTKNIEIMASKSSESILALLAGAAIGVGIGILFAPDKGSNTRDKIKNSFDDLKDGVKSKFGSFEDEAKEKFSQSKDELKETVESLLSQSSYKAEEAITFLEEKLAELKKQNAKLQK
jgi:gas vesicle protein